MAGMGIYFAVDSTGEANPQTLETPLPSSVTAPAPADDPIEPDLASPQVDADADAGATTVPLYFSGTGTWTYADGRPGEIAGTSGTLLRYNIAVENGLQLDVEEVATTVAATLADDRSWTSGGAWRFEQVSQGSADFTVYLASPDQRAQLCGSTNTTVSCRNGDKVVINSARWITGVDHWDGTIETYREYAINHEVGHRLGHSHEICPAAGEPSPLMAQQTFQLAGCTGNAWPYPDGKTYVSGPAGEYGGPDLPPDDYADE